MSPAIVGRWCWLRCVSNRLKVTKMPNTEKLQWRRGRGRNSANRSWLSGISCERAVFNPLYCARNTVHTVAAHWSSLSALSSASHPAWAPLTRQGRKANTPCGASTRHPAHRRHFGVLLLLSSCVFSWSDSIASSSSTIVFIACTG